jgi:hypothetical protein
MDLQNIGKWLIVIGLGLAVVGGALWVMGRVGVPLGRLPGDIRIEREGFRFYFPITSSILVSVALTILINLILRLIKK